MGKAVKIIAGVALVGVAIAATVATGGTFAAIGTALSGGLFKAGIVTAGFLATVGATLLASTFLIPKIPKSQLSRLNVSLDVSTPRKAVLGTTAFPLDLRYHEATGTDQEYIHYIIAHAAHKVQSIDSIYFEQDLAWTSASGVTSKYSGYLTVTTRTEGAAGNEVSISSNWGTGERLTGCAYTYIKIKRTGNTKKSDSPLVSGLPSRVTVIGEGAYLYDPRLDSTVTGGSGSHRADDQDTWGAGYSPADSYDNPALQLLWWLLGWKINGKLSIGCGVPPSRIDMESFIAAANICDEDVALSGGGTQKRYRSSGTASDADDRMDIINAFLSSMNGTLRDNGGKLSLDILKNDLAEYVLDLVDEDVLDEFQWEQTPSLSKTYNTARGRFVDPSANSLYQMVDYPEVNLAGGSPDGIDRVMTVDLPFVEEGRRAQRIAKQVLQRNQYRGQFSAVFSAKALGCDIGEIVRISFEPLGWSQKLFRVISKDITQDGRIPLTLLEENAAIYAWDAEEGAVVSATAPTVYDPLNSPFILGDLEAGTTADWPSVTDPVGTKPEDSATKNETTYSATPPASPTDGDIWVDTSTIPYKFKLRDGGAWVDASTLNTGALADLNDIDLSFVTDAGALAGVNNVDLAGIYVTGFLPEAKADAVLINTNQIYTDITGVPTALSDINGTEGAKLTGIEPFATQNTGALADLDNITLSLVTDAGGFAALDNLALTSGLLTGTLPTAKADADLINQNQLYADVTGTPTSLSDVNAGEGSKLTGIESGATVGAKAGVNLLDGSDVTLGDADIKNSAVTIAADGTLSGAGGGQVTINGLGYIGDLNATLGATWSTNITGQPTDAALLNAQQVWADISGAGLPEDNATVGATWSTNITGQPTDAALLNVNQIYSEITGTPTSLSDVNAGEGTKLTGIAAGATVGATAGTNLFDSGAAVLNDEAVKNALQQWADILGPLKPEDSATKLRTFKDENEPFPVTLRVGDPAFDSPSLSMSFVDSFREGDVWFRPTSKLVARWDADTASWTTNLADITKTIAGPSGYTLTYNQSGVLQDTTPIKLYYRVSVAGGSALTSGVTWGVSTRLLTGQTDSDIWSGTAPSISGTGVGELSINSGLKVSQATVDVTATVGGTTYGPFAVLIGKQTVSTTSESSAFQSQSIAGTVVSGTTFTQIAALTVTTQPAGTSVDLTANTIGFVCKDNEAYSPSNMQFKWQYESSPSTWTDVGAAADSNPDPFTINEGGFYESTFGSITCDRTKSSLSSNTSYNFRLMARISSGETTKDFQIGLSESVSAEAV